MQVDAAPVALPARGVNRSAALLRAFRRESTDPGSFYPVLALDTVRQVARYTPLEDRTVLDVGGGPGWFSDAFRGAGARYAGLDPDPRELFARGGSPSVSPSTAAAAARASSPPSTAASSRSARR